MRKVDPDFLAACLTIITVVLAICVTTNVNDCSKQQSRMTEIGHEVPR
jgi:hypothetical protein